MKLKPLFRESVRFNVLDAFNHCIIMNKYLYLFDYQYNTYLSFGQILEDDEIITATYHEDFDKDYTITIFEFETNKFKYKIYYKYGDYNILESVRIEKEAI